MICNERQKKIKERIQKFSEKYMNKLPIGEFSREAWERCASYGILASLTLKEYGGLAESYEEILMTQKWIGYYFNDNGFVFALCNSLIVYLGVFPKFASKSMKEEHFQDIIAGKYVASYAVTESNSGSDVYNMQTECYFKEETVVINGSKMYISNGPISDLFVVVAKNKNIRKNEFTSFLVKKDDKGVKIGKTIEKMGLEACPMSEVVCVDCEIPRSRTIGSIGMGAIIGNSAFDWEKCISFTSHLGKMEKILEDCISYVNRRKQFGNTIGHYQMISEKIVKMKVAIELGNAYLSKIIQQKENNKFTFLETSIFKYYVGEMYAQICLDAMQIYGAYGYCKESGIEQEVRDALGAKIYSGTSEVQLYNIARLIGIKE